ncbi:A24 family peptidase [Paenibacillus sp.]|uniref:prepilin peptidase n=1 Tax=Paenibacillus sp. TaxID=58172 RepID=UPI002D4E57B3|nr:A24 family peptidase [Paenibacillus sp.]HZG56051.1 A24 family peptidase [Paenibacillus sp.]
MEQLHLWFALALGALGLLVGSFLNVVAIRVLKKESIVFPPSHCVHCRHRLRAYDLVPVVSYLALRGRCRDCRGRISPVYPVGEAATAALYAWVGWHYGPLDLEWVAGLLLVSILVVITHTDLKSMLIPDAVVFPALGLAVLLRAFLHPQPLWSYAAAAAAGFGLLYALAVVSKGGMGGGDIKLYLFIGALCGLQATFLSLFAASALGAAYGIAVRGLGRLQPKQAIPFGPFIAVGAFLSFLYGEAWVDGYIRWMMS